MEKVERWINSKGEECVAVHAGCKWELRSGPNMLIGKRITRLKRLKQYVERFVNNDHVRRGPVKLWRGYMGGRYDNSGQLEWLICNHERAAQAYSGRSPSNRPLLYWPDSGKVRIEFVRTFSTITSAIRFVKDGLGDEETTDVQ